MEKAVFYFLAALTVIPAVCVVTLRNVFHAALFLVLSLVGVAGLYASLGADFLFAAQILVYAGGVMVLMLFVVLLSGSPKDWVIKAVNTQWPVALAMAALVGGLVGVGAWVWPAGPSPLPEPVSAAGDLGSLLLGEMLLPFEAVSLVLLAALVGAVLFSSKKTGGRP